MSLFPLFDGLPLREPIVPTPHDRLGRKFRPHGLGEGDVKTWWRLTCLGRPVAPWRRSKREALRDAVELGHASVSKRYDAVFLTAPASVFWIDLAAGGAGEI